MPTDPLRKEHIKQLIGQLRGVEVAEGQRLIAKWLGEQRITREALVASLTPHEKATLLGAPAPPIQNWISRLGLIHRAEGRARLAEWEQAAAEWRRAYLNNRNTGGATVDHRDEHGQPSNPVFHAARRTLRDASELLGIAKGVLADGDINDTEATFFAQYVAAHPEIDGDPVLRLLAQRVRHIFADGRIDEEERRELKGLLEDLVGGKASLTLGYDAATELPLDKPAPLMCYGRDEVYVFTGRFAYGTRRQCQQEVLDRQSEVEDNVTRRTTFVVIGSFGSRDWTTSSYGTKIRRAVELREGGFAIRLVSEDHWASNLR